MIELRWFVKWKRKPIAGSDLLLTEEAKVLQIRRDKGAWHDVPTQIDIPPPSTPKTP